MKKLWFRVGVEVKHKNLPSSQMVHEYEGNQVNDGWNPYRPF